MRELHAALSLCPTQLSSRLESVCNFALQLESEVEAGQKAHTDLEEQFEMLSQVSGPSACLSACMCVCLPACLSVCLPVCVSVCLPVCQPVWIL